MKLTKNEMMSNTTTTKGMNTATEAGMKANPMIIPINAMNNDPTNLGNTL